METNNSFFNVKNVFFRTMFSVVQQIRLVGTHDKKIEKELLAVPSHWFKLVDGDRESGVLYWPPKGTKNSVVEKWLADCDSKPDKETWDAQHAVLKRSKVKDLRTASVLIKSMQCTLVFYCLYLFRL